jgi:hypothetical protein
MDFCNKSIISHSNKSLASDRLEVKQEGGGGEKNEAKNFSALRSI